MSSAEGQSLLQVIGRTLEVLVVERPWVVVGAVGSTALAVYLRNNVAEVISSLLPFPYNLVVGALGMSVLLYLGKQHFNGGVCTSKTLLTGKTAIVTGANVGIGLETAADFALRGARVILACRSMEKGKRAEIQIRKKTGNQNVYFAHLDLASMKSVHTFARKILEEEQHIDILVNNAGVMCSSFRKTPDGYETTFATNYLGPFLLTNLLLQRMKASGSSRIVTVISLGAEAGKKLDLDNFNSEISFKMVDSYNQSKVAGYIFTRSLAKKLCGSGVLVYGVHPGVVRTDIAKDYNRILVWLGWLAVYYITKSPWQGAQTTIHCAVSKEVEGESGEFFADCKVRRLDNPILYDEEVAAHLWAHSAKLVGLDESNIVES